MRLTAAEPGFSLDHRIAAGASDATQHVLHQSSHAGRDVGALEEIEWVAVFRRVGPSVVHLLQVGCELRLAECVVRDIAVRGCDIAPWLQAIGGTRFFAPPVLVRCRWRCGMRRRRHCRFSGQCITDAPHLGCGFRRVDAFEYVGNVIESRPDVVRFNVALATVRRSVPCLGYQPQLVQDGTVVVELSGERLAPPSVDQVREIAELDGSGDAFAATQIPMELLASPITQRLGDRVCRLLAGNALHAADNKGAHSVEVDIESAAQSSLVRVLGSLHRDALFASQVYSRTVSRHLAACGCVCC